MSERKIKRTYGSSTMEYLIRNKDRSASHRACTGAPASIQPGAVVALAEALDRAEDRIESERRSGEFDPLLEEIRAALALYNGTGVE